MNLTVKPAKQEDVYRDIVRIPEQYRIYRVERNPLSGNMLRGNTGDQVELMIQKVGLCEEFKWAWNASDPVYRVAARTALLSVVLGVVSFVLDVVSIVASFLSGILSIVG